MNGVEFRLTAFGSSVGTFPLPCEEDLWRRSGKKSRLGAISLVSDRIDRLGAI
jgi:hypothetical protein